VIEHLLPKQRVAGSIPVSRSRYEFLDSQTANQRSLSWKLRAAFFPARGTSGTEYVSAFLTDP
jgi:hypothetical protein